MQPLGTAAGGSSANVTRADHVHPSRIGVAAPWVPEEGDVWTENGKLYAWVENTQQQISTKGGAVAQVIAEAFY